MTRLLRLGIAVASAAFQPPLARRAFLRAPARRAPVDAVAANSPATTLRKKAAARVLGGLVGAAALAPGAALAKGGGYGASSAPSPCASRYHALAAVAPFTPLISQSAIGRCVPCS